MESVTLLCRRSAAWSVEKVLSRQAVEALQAVSCKAKLDKHSGNPHALPDFHHAEGESFWVNK